MMTVYLQDFARARADVYQVTDRWVATLFLYDERGDYISVHAPGSYEYRVQALQAAFDMVDQQRAALLALSDVVMKEDMEASIEEKKLIENGSEAIA